MVCIVVACSVVDTPPSFMFFFLLLRSVTREPALPANARSRVCVNVEKYRNVASMDKFVSIFCLI